MYCKTHGATAILPCPACAREQIAANLAASISEMQATLDALPCDCQEWLVQVGGLTLAFDARQQPQVSTVLEASRFSEGEAKRLARLTRNGRQERGEAIRLGDALRAGIASLQETRSFLVARVVA
jgi:hypothetical protein